MVQHLGHGEEGVGRAPTPTSRMGVRAELSSIKVVAGGQSHSLPHTWGGATLPHRVVIRASAA